MNKFTMDFNPRKYLLLFLLVGLVLIMTFANGYFFTVPNVLNILRNISMQGVLAFGMTMVIICGEIDLSVSSTVAMTGVIIGLCCGKWTFMPEGLAFLCGVLICLILAVVIGLINTYFIVKFKVNSMIVTLGMMNVVYGFSGALTKGFPIITYPSWYSNIGSGMVMGFIPNAALILVLVFIVFHFIMSETKLGRDIYATGGNINAARLSGINVVRTKMAVMIIVQITAVLSGIILSSMLVAGNHAFAREWGMVVVSSVIIGGSSFLGGIGTVSGTFVGLVLLGVISNSMTLLNFNEFAQYIVRGAMMLFAIVMNNLQTSRKTFRKR